MCSQLVYTLSWVFGLMIDRHLEEGLGLLGGEWMIALLLHCFSLFGWLAVDASMRFVAQCKYRLICCRRLAS